MADVLNTLYKINVKNKYVPTCTSWKIVILCRHYPIIWGKFEKFLEQWTYIEESSGRAKTSSSLSNLIIVLLFQRDLKKIFLVWDIFSPRSALFLNEILTSKYFEYNISPAVNAKFSSLTASFDELKLKLRGNQVDKSCFNWPYQIIFINIRKALSKIMKIFQKVFRKIIRNFQKVSGCWKIFIKFWENIQ